MAMLIEINPSRPQETSTVIILGPARSGTSLLAGMMCHGGVPLMLDGSCCGAVGVAGMAPGEDIQVAKAAVKAIGFNPSDPTIISGGGCADRKLRIFSLNTLQLLNEVDTGSQVCNLTYSSVSD